MNTRVHSDRALSGPAVTEPRKRRLQPPSRGLRRAAWARWFALAPLVVAAGCSRDTRISMAQLAELEQKQPRAAAAVPPDQLGLTEYRPYKIGIGDVLLIRMIGLVQEPYAATEIQCRVHDDGCIIVPYAGAIKVAGLDLGQAEQAIMTVHQEKAVKELSVYVQLANQENTTVLVLGAATTPGLVKLKHNERNALYALAAAGGFGGTSSGRVRIRPIRTDRTETVYNFNDVNDVRGALLGPPLESGDMLVVEGHVANAVYVTGIVNHPGPVEVPVNSTLSVQRAIAAAGGLRDLMAPSEATLVRQMPDGRQVQVKLDLGSVLAGNEVDLAMRPGDVLQIPYTADTFIQDWFYKNMLLGPFSVGVRYDPLAQYNANRAIAAENNSSGGNAWLSAFQGSLTSVIPQVFATPTTP